ncbi:hypothetical protein MLD38_038749 [Melastoma candidum]|uniref:Uncharacterized protein n=1 Tax=Melastoma candidum TaxID=119954 RepID=A0ACB9L166_9MYRT|nr:hypothetical protein MLD38_038749 [Melastoma candidum]
MSSNTASTVVQNSSPRPRTSDHNNRGQLITARPIICQICNRRGHAAATCNLRYNRALENIPEALAALSVDAGATDVWYPDSGATDHMTSTAGMLHNFVPYSGLHRVRLGDGTGLSIAGVGQLHLRVNDHILRLTDVLYVPQLCHNLISIKRLCHDNFCSVEFDGSSFVVKDRRTGTELLRQQNEGAQYRLPLTTGSSKTALATIVDWHSRLCHPHSDVVRKLGQLRRLPHVFNKTDHHYCNSCALGKSRRLPFTVSSSRATQPFHLLHADVWKSPIESNSGFNYYVVFIDDHTRYAWLYLLRRKSEVFDRFIHLHTEISTQFSASGRALQCDGGGEFVNDSMRTFLSDRGILLRIACPYTPQQNGISERRHQHLANLSRTILVQSGLPTKFWADAVSTANFVVNRLPSSAINYDVPYELLYRKQFNYNILRPFGCLCFPYIGHIAPHKLANRSVPCVFLGYSDLHKGFRCFDPVNGRLYTSRHVRFLEDHCRLLEDRFPYNDLVSQSSSPTLGTTLPQLIPLLPLVPPDTSSAADPLLQPSTIKIPVPPISTADAHDSSHQPVTTW